MFFGKKSVRPGGFYTETNQTPRDNIDHFARKQLNIAVKMNLSGAARHPPMTRTASPATFTASTGWHTQAQEGSARQNTALLPEPNPLELFVGRIGPVHHFHQLLLHLGFDERVLERAFLLVISEGVKEQGIADVFS